MNAKLAVLITTFWLTTAVAVAHADVQAINEAQWKPGENANKHVLIKAQVMLARARFSPGEVDGKMGDNFRKALAAFAVENGLTSTSELNADVWQKIEAVSSEPVLTDYSISEIDVKGPFNEKLPTKMEEMKDLSTLAYRSPRERLAEKFHMSEELLIALNPERDFSQAGQKIVVANVNRDRLGTKVARIEVDKTNQILRAFDRNEKLIAFYPITAGSAEKPAPAGRLKITGVRKDPTYRYNPAYAFKGVKATEPFTIKPGPNNPVGLVWIGLSGEGYGIHGTPEPSKISKSESHGCIRMTNWDALELASGVVKGTPVDFGGDESSRSKGKRAKRNRRG